MSESQKIQIEMPRFTPRNLAKFAAATAVQIGVTSLTASLISSHTSFEKDAFSVKFGAHMVGYSTAGILSPVTDLLVDKTADFASQRIADRKAKRLIKKTEKETPEKK